jgi:methylmalonyl-CoA mutase
MPAVPESHVAESNGSEPLELAAGFPTASREQWRELVAAVLAKSGSASDLDAGDPELALSATTYDGITIAPLYTAADVSVPAAVPGQAPFVRGASSPDAREIGWDVRQRHADPDPARTNAAVLAELANGGTSLWLEVGDGAIAVADLPAALAGVYLDLAPIALDAGAQSREAAAALLALADAAGVGAQLAGTLGADPIGLRARTGADADLTLLADLAELTAGRPRLRAATVDGTVYHDAGGSDSDELAVATSVGVAYLRALTGAGLSVDAALDQLEFRLAVTADQFLSIAKLRAARRVWDRVGELSGASPDRTGQCQHAVTSAAMMTQRDPWVNLLRTTIGCFAAALGGAAAITVAPFDAAIGLPDDFARRIARNTQSVLHDESNLARVADAGGGSWYLESLTDALARKAWDGFTALERAGGALAALEDGTLAALLAPARQARRDDVAHRRAPITGVSEFALISEAPVTRRAARPAVAGGLLPALRYAEEFEALRDRADAHAETYGARPVVFLAALGPFAAHSGRVGFAANLFQAAGIETVTGTGDADALIAAFGASGSSVACLCSSDRIYVESAASEASALKAAGASFVWLAGRPGEREEIDRSAGVDGYLFVGVDALAALATTFDALGVK